MTIAQRTPVMTRRGREVRRTGFLVAIFVNVVLLWIVNNLLAWGLVPFLTAEFAELLWLIDLSVAATILFNSFWVAHDATWFRSLGQIGLNLLSVAVGLRMYQVFPFDFSAYASYWEQVARAVIVFSLLGLALGTILEFLKLARSGLSNIARSNLD